MSELLLDAAGRRRSPATLPEFHPGRPPRNKGMRYPADPPTIDEIVAVMRRAGDGVHGRRLRGLIVVLCAPACGSTRRSRSPRPTWTRVAGRCWCGAARAAGAARSGWTTGPGSSSRLAAGTGRAAGRTAVLRRQRRHARAPMGGRRRAIRAATRRPRRRRAATLRAAPTPPRPRRRDGLRGRAADRHLTPTRPHQPRHHLDLPPRHRQHRDHRYRARPPRPDDPRPQLAAPLNGTNRRRRAGSSSPPILVRGSTELRVEPAAGDCGFRSMGSSRGGFER